jgi:mono/diheme cytochrome c family protein
MEAGKKSLDSGMNLSYITAMAHINGRAVPKKKEVNSKFVVNGISSATMQKGKAIYMRDGYCGTCHQPDGKGLTASGFPPLALSKWVVGSEERLIKIVLKGIYGPIEVNGKKYPGQVPMTPYEGMLDDEEVASVLTYVRNAFGNKAPAVTSQKVKQVRAAIKTKTGFYKPDELLTQHPMEK